MDCLFIGVVLEEDDKINLYVCYQHHKFPDILNIIWKWEGSIWKYVEKQIC